MQRLGFLFHTTWNPLVCTVRSVDHSRDLFKFSLSIVPNQHKPQDADDSEDWLLYEVVEVYDDDVARSITPFTSIPFKISITQVGGLFYAILEGIMRGFKAGDVQQCD
ncbi:hypothetical protein GEMRC1_003717 [Eukaryota sp. GEM-RC1]